MEGESARVEEGCCEWRVQKKDIKEQGTNKK
jgi:hypothetical protein